MESTNERKRSFTTASEGKIPADGPNKRPRSSDEAWRRLDASRTKSQPVPSGSIAANRLAHNVPFPSSAPRSVSGPSKSNTANKRVASSSRTSLAPVIDRSSDFPGPVHRSEYPQSPELVARSLFPGLSFFNQQIIPGNASTDQNIPKFFPLLPAVFPGPSTEFEEPNTEDALIKGVEPLNHSSQSTRSAHGDVHAQVESSNNSAKDTSRGAPQVPLDNPEQGLTHPQSLPMISMPSPPSYRLPTKGSSDDQSPIASQDAKAEDAAPAAQAEDSTKSLKLQDSQNRLKKENIAPELKVESHPLKPQSSHSKMKSHEASSNLSKASPTHPSITSQNRSAKKIRTPFRSPLFNKTLTSNQQQPSSNGSPSRAVQTNLSSALQLTRPTPELTKRGALSRIKGTGTTAARAAFKSPLHSDTSASGVRKPAVNATSSSRKGGAASRNDPVQNQLQLLRRAVKIKESGEDEKLEVLVGKWKEVAKEVAWELWGLVKEGNVGDGAESRSIAGSGAAGGSFGLFSADRNDRGWGSAASGTGLSGVDGAQPNWGWDDAGEEKDTVAEFAGASDGMEEKNATEDEDEEPNVVERSMGTMLRQLGIAQETLGWDEEEGDFTEIAT